jgi:beta-lactamase superfamily II metal-dependent hydrolase
MFKIKCFFICFTLLFSSIASADWVTPAERVKQGISLREGPSSSSGYLGQLNVGQRLELIRSVPYWHEVQQADGTPAFVSKSWSTIIPDDASTSATTNPFTIDVIDVGTGLAVLIKGSDFSVLYDGGSNDDLATGPDNRLMAFLSAAYPNLIRLDHVILSHPHRDHVELLPDVMRALEIGDVWDAGAINNICGYRAFIDVVADKGLTYHNARYNYGMHAIHSPEEKSCYGSPNAPFNVTVDHSSQIDEQPITLGDNASMRFLHASGTKRGSYNNNSLIVRFDLGGHRILFMGDAEAGERNNWNDDTPKNNSIEGILLACCSTALRADILIAGHHGSRTSSRKEFLDAVQATTYIISSGPKKYGSVVLPDAIVVTELDARGDLFRTDRDDAACANDTSKIGPDADGKAGGCDNIRITLNNNISTQYLNLSD